VTAEAASPPAAPLRIHLGCGRRFIPGYVHVDIADFPHIDHRAAIDELPMFTDAAADLIYCCHAFEYFDRDQGTAVLKEWRRVLRPGGVLRLAVPDFEALCTLYSRTGDIGLVLGPLYGRMTIGTGTGAQLIYHRTVYDFASLERMCLEAGFRACRRYDWRATDHRGVDDFSQAYYPHMDKENGLLISLNVEAVR
jgi:predicted SAM-dependent methyltransferase